MEYVYRGLHARHPERAAALNGVVVPGRVSGTVSPEEHNRGGWSAFSPYTSWTSSEALARSYACQEKGFGTILRLKYFPPMLTDRWRWVVSSDVFEEGEILLYGVRLDAEVLERELPCRGDGEVTA